MIINIIIGILGLGVIVLIHELGHFLAAKIVGIKVEAFSIGWGPVLFARKKKQTEFRLSLIPLGGYCKFKGEHQLETAIDNNLKEFEKEEGAFYSASPLKRIFVSFMGPFFNIIFAFIVYAFIWGIGFNVYSYDARIVLYSEIDGGTYPSDIAGLQSGDLLLSIDNQPVQNFSDIRRYISTQPDEIIDLEVERDGLRIPLSISPELDKETGAGIIGILAWVDPIIGSVKEGGPAWLAGMQEGDKLLSLNDQPIVHAQEISLFLQNTQHDDLVFTIDREGEVLKKTVIMNYTEEGIPEPGFGFQVQTYPSPSFGFFGTLEKSAKVTIETITTSIKSLGLLFKGIDLKNAVGGPIRITYMIGEASSQGFSNGIGDGLYIFFSFAAIISIALFIMNLLPIPALDGGQIILFLIELIAKKPVSPKIVLRFQTIGFIIILLLVFFTTTNDIMFLFSGME